MNDVATAPGGALIESVLLQGDLSKLTPKQRADYYLEVCRSLGLNPLTNPFAYITLNGKLTLYALRACTDQLRTIHNVSVEEMSDSEREGVYIVTCKVKNAAGRTDMSKGAVPIANLKGEALANAIMKTETKAKRRATLSLCGLGMLDETEVETIPGARPGPPVEVSAAPRLVSPPAQAAAQPVQLAAGAPVTIVGLITEEERELARKNWKSIGLAIHACKTLGDLAEVGETYKDALAAIKKVSPTGAEQIADACDKKKAELMQAPIEQTAFDADADNIPL